MSLIPSNPTATAAGAGGGGGGGRAGLRNGGYGRDGLYGGEGMGGGGGMAQVHTPPSEEAVETLMVRQYTTYLCMNTNTFMLIQLSHYALSNPASHPLFHSVVFSLTISHDVLLYCALSGHGLRSSSCSGSTSI